MSESLQRLLGVMRRLRDPQSGCAWDRAQTMASIMPHTLEEAQRAPAADVLLVQRAQLVHLRGDGSR